PYGAHHFHTTVSAIRESQPRHKTTSSRILSRSSTHRRNSHSTRTLRRRRFLRLLTNNPLGELRCPPSQRSQPSNTHRTLPQLPLSLGRLLRLRGGRNSRKIGLRNGNRHPGGANKMRILLLVGDNRIQASLSTTLRSLTSP